MRKQLGVLTSLFFLLATTLMWVGCSGRCGQSSCYYDASSISSNSCCQAVCPEQDDCCQWSHESNCNNPCGEQVIASNITCDGVRVVAKTPRMCMLGDIYHLNLEVTACRDVCDVEIYTMLPEGITFLKSDPDAFVDEDRIGWSLGHMCEGECRAIHIELRCECEGQLCTCFCVRATPVAFCSILCARPILVCEKCGPEDACPGDMLTYTVRVTNKGSCTAYDVVVTDNVPEGLEHASGMKTLTFRIGNLAPCETKCLNIGLCANTRGRVCNNVVVTACNANQTSCECCTTICKYCCEVTKDGPKEVKIGQNADYTITVTNVGDRSLTDVVVTDCAPNGTSIVSANGATITGNRATWRIEELKSGEKINLPITLTTCTPGCYCNRVSVTNCQGCGCCAETMTRWRGTPALNICVVDMEDPICVGDNTSYRVVVTNQGSELDNNVRVVLRFPRQIVPVSAVGASPGQVSGQTVTFAPYSPLAPRQTIEYRIDARAKEAGDARIKVEVMSDSITTPIVQEESTIVN